ncbi:MAG: hypothetical protein IPI36_03970 [Chitinophagaceae bacterium]|nr:hypothetical protein [Chitinophagaceae bacterium]
MIPYLYHEGTCAKAGVLVRVKSSIYKYKIEQDATTGKTILSEGEFKLEACENMVREISE